MKRDVKVYPDEFKITVVKEVLSGKISKEECRRRYGIGGKSTVLKWIRKFTDEAGELKYMKENNSEQVNNLQKQINLLKKELQYERLKSSSYLEMIKIAEEELKISIRKKSGAKQSNE